MPDSVRRYYQDPSVAATYDQERFEDLRGRTLDFVEKRTLRRALERIRGDLTTRPQALDIPCGTGRITEVLLEEGLEVAAGDISAQMLPLADRKCARHRARVAFCRVDLDQIGFADRSFDLVTCFRLFHHLDTTQRTGVLCELARVSRRYVLANMPYSSPFYRFRRRVKRVLGMGAPRFSSSAEEILQEASTAGLEVTGRYLSLPLVSENLLVLYQRV